MYFVRKLLETEVDPMNLPSRDKTRTNQNGINLEFVKTLDEGFMEKKNNPFAKERGSVDMPKQNYHTPRN